MTTLKTKQVEFLKDYTLMQIEDDVKIQLDELRKGDEWKAAIEAGKKDANILKGAEDQKSYYTKKNKLFELNQEVEEICKDSELSDYTLAYKYGNGNVDRAYLTPFTEKDIEKTVTDYINNRVENYALKQTNIPSHWNSRWDRVGNHIRTEIDARLSVTNLDNFDAIVDGTLSHFDIDAIVQAIRDDRKNESCDECVEEACCKSC